MKSGRRNFCLHADGSKMKSGTGSGIFCSALCIEKSIRLRDSCTVFQAEMLAIKEAATLLTYIDRVNPISIYVDSQAAIKSLMAVEIKSHLVKQTLMALNKLGLRNRIRLCWVPGHEGLEGNEKADALAIAGSDLNILEATDQVVPPLSWAKVTIKEKNGKRMDA